MIRRAPLMHLVHVGSSPVAPRRGLCGRGSGCARRVEGGGGGDATGHTGARSRAVGVNDTSDRASRTSGALGPKQGRRTRNEDSSRCHTAAGYPRANVASSQACTATHGRNSASIVAPALDLNALKERLKETKAIGVFTKLSLKNQVDDLLQQFRDFYQGKAKVTMAQLRRSYDLLLMKVLSLLQDADQKLAAAIVSSREAIWGLLADPKKFATLEG